MKDFGVSDTILGKIVATPPNAVAWLAPQDMAAMGVYIENNDTPLQGETAAQQTEINRQIDAFKADTIHHPYFEDVRGDMIWALTYGGAATLEQAYAMALKSRDIQR